MPPKTDHICMPGLSCVLQPDLRLPRQRPQHLWCLLLLRLFLEHVLQWLQIRSEQDATQVPPYGGQSQGGEESCAGHRGPPHPLTTTTPPHPHHLCRAGTDMPQCRWAEMFPCLGFPSSLTCWESLFSGHMKTEDFQLWVLRLLPLSSRFEEIILNTSDKNADLSSECDLAISSLRGTFFRV